MAARRIVGHEQPFKKRRQIGSKDLGFFIIGLASAVRVAVVDVVFHRGSHTTCLRDVFAWHAAMDGF